MISHVEGNVGADERELPVKLTILTHPLRERVRRALLWVLLVLPALPACLPGSTPALSPSGYRDQIIVRQAVDVERLAGGQDEPVATRNGQDPRRSLLTGPAATSQPALADVLEKIPDPSEAEVSGGGAGAAESVTLTFTPSGWNSPWSTLDGAACWC